MSTHASDSESFHGSHHSFCPSSFLFFLFIQSIFSILLFLFPFLQYRSPSPSFLYTIFLSLSTLSPLSVSRCLILKLQTESLRNIDPPWLKGQNRVGKKKERKKKEGWRRHGRIGCWHKVFAIMRVRERQERRSKTKLKNKKRKRLIFGQVWGSKWEEKVGRVCMCGSGGHVMNEGKGGKHGWRVFVKEVGVKGKKTRNEAKELRREEEVWEENRILRGEKQLWMKRWQWKEIKRLCESERTRGKQRCREWWRQMEWHLRSGDDRVGMKVKAIFSPCSQACTHTHTH